MKQAKETGMDRVTYLTTAPIPKLIRQMSIPTIISMLVTSFYNLVDTAFVGRIDTQATAAVGISFSVMALIQAFSFLFGHGSGNYMSRRLGARDYEDAERMASVGFYSLLIGGVLLSTLGVIYVKPLARFLGSTETILPYAVSYLRVIFIGAPFMMGSFCLNNHMRFQGSANISMIGIVSGAILNIVLDPIMIFAMDLGITGAALATIISQMFSFFLLLYLNLTRATIKVKIRKFTPNWHYYKNIFKGGIPSLVRQGIGSVATILLNKQAGLYGAEAADAAIAAMGVVTRITNFAYAALIGFGQGFQPVCGTNYGAKNYKRVKDAFTYCVKLGTASLLILSVLGFVFARPMVALFRDDADVIAIGALALRIQWVSFTLNAYVVVSTMLLQTIGMPLKASIVTMARQGLFFIPLILILPQFLGLLGVQCTQAVADVLSFILAIPVCRSVLKTLDTDA